MTYVHGDEPRPPRRREPAAAFVLWTLLLSLALFVPYFYQGARLMAPAATLLVVVSAGALGGYWPRAHIGAPKREGRLSWWIGCTISLGNEALG